MISQSLLGMLFIWTCAVVLDVLNLEYWFPENCWYWSKILPKYNILAVYLITSNPQIFRIFRLVLASNNKVWIYFYKILFEANKKMGHVWNQILKFSSTLFNAVNDWVLRYFYVWEISIVQLYQQLVFFKWVVIHLVMWHCFHPSNWKPLFTVDSKLITSNTASKHNIIIHYRLWLWNSSRKWHCRILSRGLWFGFELKYWFRWQEFISMHNNE